MVSQLVHQLLLHRLTHYTKYLWIWQLLLVTWKSQTGLSHCLKFVNHCQYKLRLCESLYNRAVILSLQFTGSAGASHLFSYVPRYWHRAHVHTKQWLQFVLEKILPFVTTKVSFSRTLIVISLFTLYWFFISMPWNIMRSIANDHFLPSRSNNLFLHRPFFHFDIYFVWFRNNLESSS